MCVMGFESSSTVEREFDEVPYLSCSHVCVSLSTLPHIHVSTVACVSTNSHYQHFVQGCFCRDVCDSFCWGTLAPTTETPQSTLKVKKDKQIS